jgi:hypothetical protein
VEEVPVARVEAQVEVEVRVHQRVVLLLNLLPPLDLLFKLLRLVLEEAPGGVLEGVLHQPLLLLPGQLAMSPQSV